MILIAGDSFSDGDPTHETCTSPTMDRFSWVEQLSKTHQIRCVALAGASNWDILQQIAHWTGPIIANVSSLKRTSIQFERSSNPRPPVLISRSTLVQRNREIARHIARRSSYCWTPFPGYETVAEIDKIYIPQYSELFGVTKGLTAHHLTRAGNEWMIEHMLGVIKEIQ